jgi:hypothetical protein
MKLDFIKKNLKLVIELLLPSLSPFARWPAQVVKQNADGTVDVTPDSPSLFGTTGLKIKYGQPGIKATIQPGARVLIGFEEGKLTRPFVELFESASATKIEITANEIIFNGGTKEVARKDDSVVIGTLAGANGGGAVTFTFTPSGGAPIASALITLTGKISTGATGVKA